MKKIFTLLAMALMALSANAQRITFSGELQESYDVEGLKLTRVDPDGKNAIGENANNFGTEEAYEKIEGCLKTGGKSSSTKNYMTLTVPAAGTLKVFVRTASNGATDRNLVLSQNDTELYNKVVQEADAVKKQDGESQITIYPVISVEVAAGEVGITYPTGALNIFAIELVKSGSGDQGGNSGSGSGTGGGATGAKTTYVVPEDFAVTSAHQTIEVKNEAGTLIATVEMLSSPNEDQLYEEMRDEYGEKLTDDSGKPLFDESKPKAAWDLKGGPENNQSLAGIVEGFDYYVIGKGNPVMSQNQGWVEGDNGWSFKVTDAVYWTPGCGALPAQGEYIRITPTVSGELTFGAYINKGNHEFYVIDHSTEAEGYTVLPNTALAVKGYFQNNGFKDGDLGENIPYEYTMPEGLVAYNGVPYVNGEGETVTKNVGRPFLGTITFNVVANTTYTVMNPRSQVGFYGIVLQESGDGAGIREIPTATYDPNAPMYNLAGQRVAKGTKGLIIQNGKKFIVK